jgi:hypothetical protein
MTIHVKKLPQASVNKEELTSLVALVLLCENFNDNEPLNERPGASWLRWGDAIAAGERAKAAFMAIN